MTIEDERRIFRGIDHVTKCPDCHHPWSLHGSRGDCSAGSMAPADERCRCARAIPIRPGEDIDDASARLGELKSPDSLRLIWGSRFGRHVASLLSEYDRHLNEAKYDAFDLKELADNVSQSELPDDALELIEGPLAEQLRETGQAIQAAQASLDRLRARTD